MMPDFFIVGAARSGTTSLDLYLSQHPEIYITHRKETHFFVGDALPLRFMGPGDERLNALLIRDEQQYARLFADTRGAKIAGEASAFYLCYPEAAPRIKQAVPDAKILIILREPVERTYSAYMMLVRDGRETASLEEGLRREKERREKDFEPMWWYTELSLYYRQVKQYLEVFGPQQVKVLLYEEFFAQPEQALRDIFAFLGVRQDISIDTSVRYNISVSPKSRRLYNVLDQFMFNPGPLEKRLKALVPLNLRMAWASKLIGMSVERVGLDDGLRALLKTCFARDVEQLAALLQRDLSCWHYQQSSIV